MSAEEGATLRTAFKALDLRPRLQVQHTISLGVLLSRARVSPTAATARSRPSSSGHSYATNGQFSTSTTLLDLTTGHKLYNLEQLKLMRHGKPFRAVDFNYWGVTFANDGNRFYATLATGHKTYLVEADLRTRTGRVIRENVECPALSPDNTRIAFKKRVDSANGPWRFTVLDLKTMRETPLAEMPLGRRSGGVARQRSRPLRLQERRLECARRRQRPPHALSLRCALTHHRPAGLPAAARSTLRMLEKSAHRGILLVTLGLAAVPARTRGRLEAEAPRAGSRSEDLDDHRSPRALSPG